MKKGGNFTAWSEKKLAALALSLVLLLTCLPGALAVDLNVDAGFYFKQSRGGTCTLASAAMMLRRRAYLDGLIDWVDVTENSVKSSAWSGGLSHSFNYKAMQVGYATLPSGNAEKTQVLVELLAQHPEGIVLYDRRQPHAVLLTDYTDGVFYCSDPAGSVSSGRVPISAASISIGSSSCYWYITSDQNSVAVQPDSLRLEGVKYPINLRLGSGMSVSGTVASASSAVLTEVEVAILNAADQTVQSAAGRSQCGQLVAEKSGQPDPLWRAARGRLQLHGAVDRLQRPDPLLHERFHRVQRCHQHLDLLVGAGPLRLEADRGRAAGRGDCGGSRRQRGTVHQELAGKTLRLSRTGNEYSKT